VSSPNQSISSEALRAEDAASRDRFPEVGRHARADAELAANRGAMPSLVALIARSEWVSYVDARLGSPARVLCRSGGDFYEGRGGTIEEAAQETLGRMR
jgi:hypothetical protein